MSEFWDQSILKAEQAAASGDYKTAEEILSQLVVYTADKPVQDKRKFIVLELLAELMEAQKRFKETEEYLLKALELRKTRYTSFHRRYAEGLSRLAAFYYEHERFQEAEPLCREVLAIYEKLYGKNAEEVGRSCGALADTLHLVGGKTDEAEEHYKRAISIRKELAGTIDSESVNLVQRYADLLEELGRKDEAEFLLASAQGRVSGIFRLIQVDPKNKK